MQARKVTQQYCEEENLTEGCEMSKQIRVEGVDCLHCDLTEFVRTRVAKLSLSLPCSWHPTSFQFVNFCIVAEIDFRTPSMKRKLSLATSRL